MFEWCGGVSVVLLCKIINFYHLYRICVMCSWLDTALIKGRRQNSVFQSEFYLSAEVEKCIVYLELGLNCPSITDNQQRNLCGLGDRQVN